jgi:anti-anti-sigma factor
MTMSSMLLESTDQEPQPTSITPVMADATRACLRLCGEIDAALAPALADRLDEHITQGRRYLRLELSGVTFMDTTALSVVLEAHHRLLASRGTLVLTGVRDAVTRLITLAKLDQVLFVSGPRSDLDAATVAS